MAGTDQTRLLQFARELQRAVDFTQMLEIVRDAVESLLGYRHAWLAMVEPNLTHVRILAFVGVGTSWDEAVVIPIEGDAMIAEILKAAEPIVVEDARIDPRTNKEMVAVLGNRTIINVPLSLVDVTLGMLGVGTMGDEGVRPPTPDALEMLMAMAAQVSVAAGRLRWQEERARAEREKLELNRRLFQAQKLESLGLLAGGVAHDFNNLLQVIIGNAHFLNQDELTEPQRDVVSEVLAAADRGVKLSRQLLAMGRKQAQSLEALDVNARLASLLQLLKRLFPAHVKVDLIGGAHLPTVLSDASQFDQVFMNLSVNARDAMPEGGRLTIESEQVVLNGEYVAAHPWAKAGRYVVVTVSDTGLGMTPEVVERVFEPFFTTKDASVGTGLGLAVAYGIVQQHGGMMHAYSEIGVGSTFKVYLPAYDRDARTVGPKLSGNVKGGTEKILIAEDNLQVQGILRRILERAGYAVTTVDDGRQAIAAVERGERFDAIILDAMMPHMGGREAYEQIRQLDAEPAFLFSSGYAADLFPASVLGELGVELLQKPYDPDLLLRAVRRALDDRAAKAANQTAALRDGEGTPRKR
jgi:signal transduction histidine kinase/ActR/RegA family two-component response regulator